MNNRKQSQPLSTRFCVASKDVQNQDHPSQAPNFAPKSPQNHPTNHTKPCSRAVRHPRRSPYLLEIQGLQTVSSCQHSRRPQFRPRLATSRRARKNTKIPRLPSVTPMEPRSNRLALRFLSGDRPGRKVAPDGSPCPTRVSAYLHFLSFSFLLLLKRCANRRKLIETC